VSAVNDAARWMPGAGAFGGRRFGRLIERNIAIYRRGWYVLASGLFEPLFYLLGIGFGLGGLIGTIPGPDGRPIPYGVFVAPALLASSAMNGAITEATFNFFFKLRYAKTFEAILSTPLGPLDIAIGESAWALIRGALYAAAFIATAAILGLIVSPWAVLAIPVALLIGFAFGTVGMAATSFFRTWQDFDLVQLVILPMFLFSGTFFPLSTYPPQVQLLIELTPLWHAVSLARATTLGAFSPGNLVDVAYLIAMGVLGLLVVSRRINRLLLK
jgi:lipooligosaccharide transport system permease protein